jgi:processive 1,2-diacylglycerol beta-glucosyltransferase
VIELFDNDTGAPIGAITDAQLQFLVDQLEEESADDTDYYINQETLDMFEERGADPALVALLRSALGAREDMEIRWERK